MTSRVFTTELIDIITNNLSTIVPVFAYDGNAVETLPCILVGVSNEQVVEGALVDNFVLEAFIAVISNGYDDQGNNLAETIKDEIITILVQGHEISCLDGIFYQGTDREDSDDSTKIIMRLRAFTHTFF